MLNKVAIFKLDKHKESPDQFEKRLNLWMNSTGDVSLLSVKENLSNGDIVFVFQSYGNKKSVAQELCLIGWHYLEELEGAVNNALTDIDDSCRNAKYLQFVTTAKSPRALAIFIVEGNRHDPTSSVPESSNASESSPESPEEKKQDQAVDVKSKRVRKPKGVA